ncbi:hypothetical protein [Specibacter sp. RAF43]|uniref:hypothetical protein n=1 Tax=Specibacter sp. RAF43 TaxID=3233057 RepID=UPI003F99F380
MEAQEVGNTSLEAGQHVASVAKDEVRNVAQEAGAQAQDLIAEFTDSVRVQAGAQQQRVADGLRSIGGELKTMAESNSETSGTATRWVREAARKAEDAAGWLDQREPGSLLEEVKRFGRRRPGAFLGIAVGAGLLAGRLTRGLGEAAAEGAPTKARPDSTVPRKVPPTPDYLLTSDVGADIPMTEDASPLAGDGTGDIYPMSDVPVGLEPPPGFPPETGSGTSGAGGRLP